MRREGIRDTNTWTDGVVPHKVASMAVLHAREDNVVCRTEVVAA